MPLAIRLRSASFDGIAGVGSLARDPKLARLEAALLLADEPIPARRIAEAAGLAEASEVRRLIERLKELYDAAGTAFQVEELAGGYQLLTRPRITPGWRTSSELGTNCGSARRRWKRLRSLPTSSQSRGPRWNRSAASHVPRSFVC